MNRLGSDHMLEAHETLRKKVRRTMGGEVLELMRDRAERLEREARGKVSSRASSRASSGASKSSRIVAWTSTW